MIAALAQDPWLFFAGILVVMTFGDGAFGNSSIFLLSSFNLSRKDRLIPKVIVKRYGFNPIVSFEKFAVLNLRHSLSTALIAAIYLGAAVPRPLNVNNLLSDHLACEFDYVNSSEFAELVH